MRVRQPELIRRLAASRLRRQELTLDGRLALVAADHPARRVTSAAGDPYAMADRFQYVGRVARALAAPGVDGVMATADVVEELLVLDHLFRRSGRPGFLEGKVIVGSGNRSGLRGARFELDDRPTGYTPDWAQAMGLDGLKVLIRIDLQERDSVATLARIAAEVREAQARDLPVFVEFLPGRMTPEGFRVEATVEALMEAAGVAAALGGTSARTWLKLPYVEGYPRIARATTLPILMLGGETEATPVPVLEDFARGMGAGPTVRGVMVGRNVLFPGTDDPLAVAGAVARIVHDGASAAEALDVLHVLRGRGLRSGTRTS
ncbi:hypothetical protein LIP_1022 [Limnochorda pilosa]|uniref:Cgl0159-like domain-containing protein n=1 Tax=Limnochorda pilosa TaxID=1555112 RepID=A0A0K2SJ62_LIMPI|nr:hypothetical protein LIP_1022 [Limnochorda pilosa]